MALEQCLIRALKARVITREQADKIRKLAGASEQDERRFLESFIQETQESQRITHLQTIATKRNMENIAAHPAGPGRGVLALLVRDIEGKAPYSNVDYRAKSILAELYGRFADAMDRYRTKNLGFSQDTAGVKSMVKELFGEATNDVDAKAFAKMWSDTADAARLRFNVAGGNIPARKDWGLPHTHDPMKIAKRSFEEWRDYTVPRLDRNRIYTREGLPMSQKQFDDLITGLYQQFQEQAGVVHDIPRNVQREIDHRLLTFKNSQAWVEYNDRFGEPDLYGSMMHHLEHMAHDTALLEILGPHPDKAMEGFITMAEQAKTRYMTTKLIKDAYQVVSGRINQPASELLANLGSTVRNLLSSAQLGSAFLSQFGDLFTVKHTLAYNGVPGVKFIKTFFDQMNPRNAADRVFAVKLGLGAEAWVTKALAASRFQEITGNGVSAKISDFVMRASLMSPWTQATKNAFGLELSGFIAEQTAKKFADLPELLRNSFTRYGIGETHWEIIRHAPLIERDGAKYLRPQDVLEASRAQAKGGAAIFIDAAENVEAEGALTRNRKGALGKRLAEGGRQLRAVSDRLTQIRDAANKLHELILTETNFAVPEPDARVKAITTQGQQKGSIMGEIARSVAMYKSFPISMMTTHLWRGASEIDGLSKAKYLAELITGLTIVGGVSVQARNLVKGKDPQDMKDPKFWGQAFVQGGGAGIFGDYIFSDVNRYGGGMVQTFAGPVASLVDDAANLTIGNLHQYLRGKEAHLGRDLVKFTQRYTPGNNSWYARLAMERLMWDSLRRLADPHAETSFRRVMQNARRDYGQEFWWKPGDVAPARAPDLGAAVGK